MIRNRIARLLIPLPEYSAAVQETPVGWRYCAMRGEMAGPVMFGLVPTREQAWACARAALAGMMTHDRAAGVR